MQRMNGPEQYDLTLPTAFDIQNSMTALSMPWNPCAYHLDSFGVNFARVPLSGTPVYACRVIEVNEFELQLT